MLCFHWEQILWDINKITFPLIFSLVFRMRKSFLYLNPWREKYLIFKNKVCFLCELSVTKKILKFFTVSFTLHPYSSPNFFPYHIFIPTAFIITLMFYSTPPHNHPSPRNIKIVHPCPSLFIPNLSLYNMFLHHNHLGYRSSYVSSMLDFGE